MTSPDKVVNNSIPCIFLPGVAVGRGISEEGKVVSVETMFESEKNAIEKEIQIISKKTNKAIAFQFKSIYWEKFGVPDNLKIFEKLFEKANVQNYGDESDNLFNDISLLVGSSLETDDVSLESENKTLEKEVFFKVRNLLEELEEKKEKEFQQLSIERKSIQDYGLVDRLEKIKNEIQRISNLRRLFSVWPLQSRAFLTTKIAVFLGDIFIYLNNKLNIQNCILQNLKKTLAENKSDTLIIFAHSFGAVIFWDMLTSNKFNKLLKKHNVKIHFISVGSQIRFFEILKLYEYQKNSAKEDEAQAKKIFDSVIFSWLNCYDNLDCLSFPIKSVASNLFSHEDPKITDQTVRTSGGLFTSHSSYFQSEDFYKLVKTHLSNFF